jgi:spore maturation protein CgeB
MSSNSCAIMPRPTFETWFMEGRLVPGVHYIEIREDYADLEEKIRYYSAHHEEAEEIARNANEWCAQFQNPERELLIALLVMQKYFDKTKQKP